jgi:phage repressor protein C with HTH and peptisase S24 domain
MTRVEIIKKAFDYLVFKGVITTRADFADAISYNRTNLSSAMNGNEKYLSDSLMGKIAQAFPVFDKNWLLTGEGAMLKVPAATMSPYPADEMVSQATPTEAMRDGVNVITDAEVLDLSNYPVEVIEELRTEIKKDEAVPIISAEVAACDKYDISEYLEEDNELEHFIPSDMTADVDGAEIVRKTSMLPTFAPNDVVFIKLIKDKTRITDGGTYYFKLRKRATMIRMAKIKGNELRLIAQNPQFGDVITTFDDVINVASIEGLYRKNIANQYNEIEALRRKKDAQTDELIKCNGDLIKQNGDALKIVDRLVAVIEKKQ